MRADSHTQALVSESVREAAAETSSLHTLSLPLAYMSWLKLDRELFSSVCRNVCVFGLCPVLLGAWSRTTVTQS